MLKLEDEKQAVVGLGYVGFRCHGGGGYPRSGQAEQVFSDLKYILPAEASDLRL